MALLRYNPPPLDKLVTLRNPEDEPARPVDDYGRPTGAVPSWGDDVWANKRDSTPYTEVAEGVLIRGNVTVFTISHRAGVGPNTFVVYKGVEYVQRGAPIERGGPNAGMLQTFIELHTELRSAAETP